MPRPKGGQRALGPYSYPERANPWRVITRGADGSRGHREFGTQEEAEAYRDKYNGAAATRRLTLREALQKYEHEYLVVRQNKPRSWPEVRRRIVRLLRDESTKLTLLTPSKAKDLYLELAQEVSVDTHRGCLTNTKTFLSWAQSSGLIDSNPLADVKGIGKKKRGKVKLTTDEAIKFKDASFSLLDSTTDRVSWERYLMGLIALYLGPRASEVTERQVRDIDEDCSVFRIPDSKTPSGRRKLRIPEELRPYLRLLVKDRPGTDYLFTGRYHKVGQKHDYRYITRYCVKPLCTALGLPPITAHGLRGTFADLSVEDGLAPLTVAKNLGQSGERVALDHYISPQTLSHSRLRRAQEKLGNVTRHSSSVDSETVNETASQDHERRGELGEG